MPRKGSSRAITKAQSIKKCTYTLYVQERRHEMKVTKKLAKEFAQKFFGTNKVKLDTLDDDVFSYTLGKITLEIFPLYGKRAKYEEPTASVYVDHLHAGTATLVQGNIEYSSQASDAIDLMHKLATMLLRAVDAERLTECKPN